MVEGEVEVGRRWWYFFEARHHGIDNVLDLWPQVGAGPFKNLPASLQIGYLVSQAMTSRRVHVAKVKRGQVSGGPAYRRDRFFLPMQEQVQEGSSGGLFLQEGPVSAQAGYGPCHDKICVSHHSGPVPQRLEHLVGLLCANFTV